MLKIWGRNNSSNVQKVLWACAETGAKYERVDVGGSFGGNREPWYLALNPNGLIPTINDDGMVLWESNAIVRYLAARYGAGSLWPTDLKVRADADRWMDWQLTTVGPALGPIFFGLVRTPPAQRDLAAIEAARVKLAEILKILDQRLAKSRFVAGDSLTMGDIPLGIIAYRWFTLPIERPDLPHLAAWYNRLVERPAFKAHCMLPLT